MNIVYIFENSIKSKVMGVVEADKYGDISFAKAGYVLKDGVDFGMEGKSLLIMRGVDENFKKHSEDKLKDIEGIQIADNKKTEEIVKKINEEEEAAQSGFGSIFG